MTAPEAICRIFGEPMALGLAIPAAFLAAGEGAHDHSAPPVDCMKCTACGHSFRINTPVPSGASTAGKSGEDEMMEAQAQHYQSDSYLGRAALAGAEARQLEVPAELARMASMLKGLEQGISHLEMRLGESIMRGAANGSVNGAGRNEVGAAPRAPSATSLGSRLQEANSLLQLLGDRVQGVITRLEA